jgi:hypothetical protein
VKVQVKLFNSALPAVSLTTVVIVAVYNVLGVKLAVGSSVATVALPTFVVVTVAATLPDAPDSVKLVPLIEARFINSENVAVTLVSKGTPVAPLAGLTETTVGRVISGPTAMVSVLVAVAPVLSVTWKVAELLPDIIGTPVIAPVVGFRDKPGGRPPAAIDQM